MANQLPALRRRGRAAVPRLQCKLPSHMRMILSEWTHFHVGTLI